MNKQPITLTRDGLPLSVLIVMVFWFSHEMILGGKLPFYRDLGIIFYPMRYSLAESLGSGELPLWNRHLGMGFPLLANFQSGSFYLPHLFLFVLPFFSALRALFLFHYLVAASGGYFLCRKWGYSPYLAMVGAILFTLGGTVVSLSNLLNHFQAAVWVPWLIFFWEKYLHQQSWKSFQVFTLIASLQFFAGSLEFYVMSMGLVLLEAFRWRSIVTGPSFRKILLSLVAVNAEVLALAMVQVLPSLELIRESRSKFPIPLQLAGDWSLNPWQLINLFFLDREVVTEGLNGVALLFVTQLPLFVSYYVGAIALPGIFLWFFYASWKERLTLLIVMGSSLLLAFGQYTPLYAFLFRILPGFQLFRYPEKFFFVTYAILVFVMLRGIGLYLIHAPAHRRGPFFILSAICVFFVGLYLLFQMDTPLLGRFIGQHTNAAFLSESVAAKTALAMYSLERQIALTLGVILLLVLYGRRLLRTSLFSLLLVVTLFFDLYSVHQPYQFLLKMESIRARSMILPRPNPEPDRIFYYPAPDNLHPSHFSFQRKISFVEFNSLQYSHLLPNTGIFHGFDYMQEFDALLRWPYNVFLTVGNRLPYERLSTLLGALNVRHLVSFQALSEGSGSQLTGYFEQYPSWLYKLDRVVPRTYIVSQIEEEKNPYKVLTRLSEAEFDPFSRVILDRAVSLPSTDKFQSQAKITAYQNQSVAIRASLNNHGILVLADSYYPGWKAYVDGKEEPILRANLFFRGVLLSPGEHVVEFRYEPRSFSIGRAISLTTLLGLALVSLILHLRGRRRPKPPEDMVEKYFNGALS